ncbi:F-box domain, cyclin-like protein [Artemisia annua]|uniref:F-box domain, cyclin-like protein n=1 Tax=Artemisia annua TaxID=35608 RepID=A0A2U1KUU7_ARTAN|nr:F-box domain, cyclin-like protein [Artemisia annua]
MIKDSDHSIVEDGYVPENDVDYDYEISERCKKRKTNLMKKECNLHDPLDVFGFDIMLIILSHLDARSVATALLVSIGWRSVASSDTIWSKKCEELWAGKAHLPRLPRVEGLSKLSAFSLSVKDGKREAPEYWRNLDPFWIGTEPSMRRYFHQDGSQTADPGDKVWGGHESCYSIVTSFTADGKMRKHYVRINRWPQMSICRRPDYGWEMSNFLYSYSSVPDAYKKGGTGPCLHVL